MVLGGSMPVLDRRGAYRRGAYVGVTGTGVFSPAFLERILRRETTTLYKTGCIIEAVNEE